MFTIDQHIEYLLLSHDCVIAPGFGGFVVHRIPARYDVSKGVVTPPSVTFGFNPDLKINDSLLVQSFVETYDMSYPEAQHEVDSEIDELRSLISDRGSYTIPSVGTLTVNEEGNYEFEPDIAGGLSPELYGLTDLMLEEGATFLRSGQSSNSGLVHDSDEESGDSKTQREGTICVKTSTVKRFLAACMGVFLLVCIPFFGHLFGAGKHSEQLSATVFPVVTSSKEIVTETPKTDQVVKREQVEAAKPESAAAAADSRATVQPQAQPVAATAPAAAPANEEKQPKAASTYYTVVLASQVGLKNAEAFVRELTANGVQNLRLMGDDSNRRVVSGSFATEKEAYDYRRVLSAKDGLEQAWVMKVRN